jgi:hypothetical protein
LASCAADFERKAAQNPRCSHNGWGLLHHHELGARLLGRKIPPRKRGDSGKCKFKNTFKLGGDATSKGEMPTRVADFLVADDTFKVMKEALMV